MLRSRSLHVLTLLLAFFVLGRLPEQGGYRCEAGEVRKVDLFTAGEFDYKLFRIPGIVVTSKGTILAYCEARRAGGDWAQIDVMLRRSTDNGKSWSPAQKLVEIKGDLPVNPVAIARKVDEPGANTVNNPVAIVDHETGTIHFLYCLEYMRCFYMSSDDDGVSWTEPVDITSTFDNFKPDYDWKVIATGPGHGIQLQLGPHKGRLVVPVWLSLGTEGNAHRPNVNSTIYSDDHGKSWQRGEFAMPVEGIVKNPNESIIVQLADGRVMLNARSESATNRRLIAISPDGATNWGPVTAAEELHEPICMAGITRVQLPTADKPGIIAFSNPDNLERRDGQEAPGKGRDRKNVSVKLSFDEGTTWPATRVLEPNGSGYSDLAALGDGTILCFYERGSSDGQSNSSTGVLTVALFDADWVQAKSEADVCVYGGTSGGVVAAIQAARLGKQVILLEPGAFVRRDDFWRIVCRRYWRSALSVALPLSSSPDSSRNTVRN
ncbi:MAG: exo-alpha-sialidase [Planctomycetaceae bacterium]